MQVEDLLYATKPHAGAIEKSASQSWSDVKKTAEKSVEPTDGVLRSISIDQPTYQKNQLTQNTAVDQLEDASSFGDDTRALKNEMVLASHTMSDEDYKKMSEEGFSPMDQAEHTIVTVSDQIKKQLAIAGVDVEALGGLSSDEITAMSGSTQAAAAVTSALEKADLPTDETILADAKTAVMKANEIGEVTPEAKEYLVKNELPPTIANVYTASFAKSQNYTSEAPVKELTPEEWEEIRPQVDAILSESGLEISEETESYAKTLLAQGVPVTAEHVQYLDALNHGTWVEQPADVVDAIVASVAEGRLPQEAYLVRGYSLRDQAEVLTTSVQSMSDDQMLAQVHDQRVVEEIRFMMTQESAFSMLKQGISVDTKQLQQLVEDLRAQEESLAKKLYPEDEAKADLFQKTTDIVADLKELPAVALGRIPSVGNTTLTEIHHQASVLQQTMIAAGERYETMATEVRRDLGDSLQKAFGNIGEILDSLDLQQNESNARAVRILAYNRMEITAESVAAMRSGDEMVQRTLKALTPGVVKTLIDEGKNPLDVSMERLLAMAEDAKEEMSDSNANSEENYAKFLWKMDRAGEMTEEQRASFIGVYRLLHQVEATDGAVIGQLMQQGSEITLRNMMEAVRTRKHENREYTIDTAFGVVEDFQVKDLSITQQIEKVFLTYRAKDAKENITPAKMLSFASEDTYMEMNPDQFATALEQMEEDPAEEEAYVSQQRNALTRALESEDAVYQMLKQYDLPVSGTNLEAMSAYLKDRNRMFELLAEIKEDLVKDFGEAMKTPEEMAEAQKKLAETAENVMRNAIMEDAKGYIDVRGMRMAVTQLKTLSTMATREETYAIPIMVADAAGNMTLKIVRGKEEQKGRVDVALDMESTGCIRGSFRMSAEGVTGEIATDQMSTRALLLEHANALNEAMAEATGRMCTCKFSWDESISANSIYSENETEFETTKEQSETQTAQLYGLARSFIDILSRIVT
ncbi:MAG: DUF6240 domain-containing protein [Lachnospiraceae bacterium]|nr:DUF6240 domain-containing protein [Lachnospiraceae bacterium]